MSKDGEARGDAGYTDLLHRRALNSIGPVNVQVHYCQLRYGLLISTVFVSLGRAVADPVSKLVLPLQLPLLFRAAAQE